MGLTHKEATRSQRPPETPLPPGLIARDLACRIAGAVIFRKATLDDALEAVAAARDWQPLEARDKAFTRLLAVTLLRRRGQVADVLGRFLRKPLPDGARDVSLILECAATQLLFLDTPAHAAIDLAVRQCQASRHGARLSGLANAVLRNVARDGPAIVATQDACELTTPTWLLDGWTKAFGADTAYDIARAHLMEPALDLSVAGDAAAWASRLGAELLATGSLRLTKAGRIEELAGYGEGAWWVQDTAASLPVKLLGNVQARTVADLCAAPGGKTAQLAAAGASVTAVDASAKRLERLRENLARLNLSVRLVEADIRQWTPGETFDAVLLDAPCSATGTIRRHPDVQHHRTAADLAPLAKLQDQLLDAAVALLRPGGTLVYCVCSLEGIEGPERIDALCNRHKALHAQPIEAREIGGLAPLLGKDGWLRTLPCHFAGATSGAQGMDGFFAARLVLN